MSTQQVGRSERVFPQGLAVGPNGKLEPLSKPKKEDGVQVVDLFVNELPAGGRHQRAAGLEPLARPSRQAGVRLRSGSDIADHVEKTYGRSVDRIAHAAKPDTSLVTKLGWALELMFWGNAAAASDGLRLGEGISTGTVEGYARDAGRAGGIILTLTGAGLAIRGRSPRQLNRTADQFAEDVSSAGLPRKRTPATVSVLETKEGFNVRATSREPGRSRVHSEVNAINRAKKRGFTVRGGRITNRKVGGPNSGRTGDPIRSCDNCASVNQREGVREIRKR
ncbi:MAG: hypothetical protein AAFV32_10225 [Myxococcota bacterium]